MVAWYILESPKYSQHRHWGFVKGQFKNELVIVLFPLKNGNQSVGSCRGDRLDCARWNSSWSLFIWIELCLPPNMAGPSPCTCHTLGFWYRLTLRWTLVPNLQLNFDWKKTYFLYTSKFHCTTYSNIIEYTYIFLTGQAYVPTTLTSNVIEVKIVWNCSKMLKILHWTFSRWSFVSTVHSPMYLQLSKCIHLLFYNADSSSRTISPNSL